MPVRHGSRSAPIPFDWENPQTWAPALAGVDKVYLTYYPDLAVPGSVDAVREITERAKQAGVRRWCCSPAAARRRPSMPRTSSKPPAWSGPLFGPRFFSQNFSEGAWIDDVIAGTVALPVGDVVEPLIDTDDIADVAVAALTDDRHIGQTYEMTGPRLLSFGDAVGEIAKATGRDVTLDVGVDGRVRRASRKPGCRMTSSGLLQYLFTHVLGHPRLGDGVQRALGREPRDFADYAAPATVFFFFFFYNKSTDIETAKTGVWAPAS